MTIIYNTDIEIEMLEKGKINNFKFTKATKFQKDTFEFDLIDKDDHRSKEGIEVSNEKGIKELLTIMREEELKTCRKKKIFNQTISELLRSLLPSVTITEEQINNKYNSYNEIVKTNTPKKENKNKKRLKP